MRNQDKNIDFDVIIIGGGAAGISAALWCDELGLRALLLEARDEIGGQLLEVYNEIKNHLGIEAKNGRDLRDIFLKQIANRNFVVRLKTTVSDVDVEKKSVKLATGEILSAQALIFATGIARRQLNVEGEAEFQKKGIIQSGKRDQNLAKDKIVAVIGGGDAAFENALILAETAEKVFLINRGKNFRARREFIEKVIAHPTIGISAQTIVQKFTGNTQLKAVELLKLKTNETEILPVDVVLIRIGVEPNTNIFRGKIALDANGFINIDSRCETKIKGIFAAGDAANPVAPTISSAVGMGATAAKAIFADLNF